MKGVYKEALGDAWRLPRQGGIVMSQSLPESNQYKGPKPPGGDEFAARIFTISMIGVCAAIVAMIIVGDW